MELLLSNIHQLVTARGSSFKRGMQMRELGIMQNAWVLVENERIKAVGSMDEPPAPDAERSELNCSGRTVLPGFVDCHTHLLFAGSLEDEIAQRAQGKTPKEIYEAGGGVRKAAQILHQTSDEELLSAAMRRVYEMMQLGTTTVEIKSGFGLNVQDELRMLRVIAQLKQKVPLRICTTVMPAHAVPLEYKNNRQAYIDQLCNDLIPRVVDEGLAQFIDALCEPGFFTPAECERVLTAGAQRGLIPRVHANVYDLSFGIQLGNKCQAQTIDHINLLGEAEIIALSKSRAMPVLLPTASFFLNIPYTPARRMLDADMGFALASNYCPVSSPSGNMQFVMALACAQYRLMAEEALNACTINAAFALGLEKDCGSIEPGKKADLLITEPMSGLAQLPYFFGRNHIEKVIIGGKAYK